MALKTTGYVWNGLKIDPYAKITERRITETFVDGIKKYVCEYFVNVYTSHEKLWDAWQKSYRFTDGERPSLETSYDDLKNEPDFEGWTDA